MSSRELTTLSHLLREQHSLCWLSLGGPVIGAWPLHMLPAAETIPARVEAVNPETGTRSWPHRCCLYDHGQVPQPSSGPASSLFSGKDWGNYLIESLVNLGELTWMMFRKVPATVFAAVLLFLLKAFPNWFLLCQH